MRLLPPLICVLLLAAVGSADRLKRQSGSVCRDSEGRAGTCGSIRQCPALLHLATSNPSRADISRLRQSVCAGSRRDRILICCATVTTATPPPAPTTTPRPATTTVPPEQHPNRPILDRGFPCGTSFMSKIVGGEDVRVGEFSWVALLGYKSTVDASSPVHYSCGGTLISLQHVLTAAQCVDPDELRRKNVSLTTVRLGEHNLEEEKECLPFDYGEPQCNNPQNFRIIRTMMHSGYNRLTVANDIALLKLDRPVTETEFIGKICLPLAEVDRRNYTGVLLTVAGFGRTGSGNSSPVLQKVELHGVTRDRCARTYRRHLRLNNATISPQQICAGGQERFDRDSCAGDVGGPLMMAATYGGPPYSLVGVVSWEKQCGQGRWSSVNTRVSEYLDWILDRLDD